MTHITTGGRPGEERLKKNNSRPTSDSVSVRKAKLFPTKLLSKSFSLSTTRYSLRTWAINACHCRAARKMHFSFSVSLTHTKKERKMTLMQSWRSGVCANTIKPNQCLLFQRFTIENCDANRALSYSKQQLFNMLPKNGKILKIFFNAQMSHRAEIAQIFDVGR